ncbi:MAG: FtsX-like permease family protein [Pseudomonadota bacterium]
MKYFALVWRSLWRKKARTILTVLSVMVAFFLYAVLSAIGYAFKGGVDLANAQRLVIVDKITFINSLPISYLNKIAAVPGVDLVTHATWFEGYYQDNKNPVTPFPVDPETYLAVYPELTLSDEARKAFGSTRTGVIVGEDLITRYGWKVGDRIPVESKIYPQKDGNRVWEFDVVGTFGTTDPKGSTPFMLFNYEYFDEARAFGQGSVGWYVIHIASGANAVEIAKAVDNQFANSPSQTKTSTEAAFAESFAKQFGNIGLIVTLILTAVFFTLLLVSGNTMSQSVRERISELAVLKTLGFKDGTVLGIVLGESLLVIALGGLLGLGLGWFVVQGIAQTMGTMLPGMYFTGEAWLIGIGLILAAGILAGIFPALKAMRLTIVDALARG